MADTTSIARRLMRDLKRDFGLTDAQAAGVVGNLAHESGGFQSMQEISPIIPGSRGGYGYAQWTGPRRKDFERYVERRNLNPASYEANYGFLKHEISTSDWHRRNFMRVKNADTVEEAARIFGGEDGYLRPGIPHMGSRVRYAQQVAQLDDAAPADGNTALAAIDEAVTPYEVPPTFPSLNRAPTPMGYAQRPASEPQAVLPRIPSPSAPGNTTAMSERALPQLPMDVQLSGAPNELTSFMDDSGQIYSPHFRSEPWAYDMYATPSLDFGSSNAGTERSNWNIPNVEVPGNSYAGTERAPQSLTADNRSIFDIPEQSRNQDALQTALEGYIRDQRLGDPQIVRAGLVPSLPSPTPSIPQSLVGQERSRRDTTPSVPGGGFAGQERGTWNTPAPPSGGLAGQQRGTWNAPPVTVPGSSNAGTERSAWAPPVPTIPSGGMAGQERGTWAAPTPPVPSGGMAGQQTGTWNAPTPKVPGGSFAGQERDGFAANRLSPSPTVPSGFDPNAPPAPNYSAPDPQAFETITKQVENPAYGEAIATRDMYNYVPPDLKMLMNFTPDEMATHEAKMAANGLTITGEPLPLPPQYITETVQVPVTPPPPPAMPFPAPRPTIAPISASMVDTELNPLARLFAAVTDDRSNRPAVGTILGTADNGGIVTQGHNGLLNSITQESDAWRRVTDPMYGVGKRKAGSRSSGGSLVG